MKALLLGAGIGSRLRPLTNHLPKCLAPIRGVPLLAIWFEQLTAAGVTDILLNTHHHADLVRDFVLASPWRDQVVLSHETELLGTGGTVLRNSAWCDDVPFILAHADNLSLFDPHALMSAHARRPDRCKLTMMTFVTPDPESCGIVELDADGTVQAFHEKVRNPPGNLANAAVYVLEPEILDLLASLDSTVIDLSTEVLPRYLGCMTTYLNDRYHRDIGTIASLTQAQSDFPDGAEHSSYGSEWLRRRVASDADLAMFLRSLDDARRSNGIDQVR